MKNRLIKICACLVGTLAVLSCLCVAFTANAAVLPEFTVSDLYQVRPGDTVSVEVNVNENRGYCAGEFLLEYDPSVLTPVSIARGEASSEYFASNLEYGNGQVFFAVISEELMSAEGNVATVTFEVDDSLVVYSGELELTVNSLVGNISVGYGLNSVRNTVNGGELYVAQKITVPAEELGVVADGTKYVLCGTSIENMLQSEITKNFTSHTTKYYSASGAQLSAATRLTTLCTVKVTSGSTTNTFVVSVKQDVDGNYKLDGEDAFIAGLVASGMLTEEELGKAQSNAADADGDGDIDADDFAIMEANGLK
ncbi:MAG: hypothetical protein IJE63_02475 [Clostridia bacterium]|nr:hypothetical protein [Clostridia bacterium]